MLFNKPDIKAVGNKDLVVKLKNGSESLESIVKAIMLNLELLREDYIRHFFELVRKCKNPAYQITSAKSRQVIQDVLAIDVQNPIPSYIQDILLSALLGKDESDELHNPIAPQSISLKNGQ